MTQTQKNKDDLVERLSLKKYTPCILCGKIIASGKDICIECVMSYNDRKTKKY